MTPIFSYHRKRPIKPGLVCDSSDTVGEYATDKLGDLLVEQFWIVLLDTKNRIIGEIMVSQGSMTASIVHPREVFLPAIINSAANIIAIHNHPCGDTTPSKEDRLITEQLRKAGNILGIKVLDHLIVGTDGWFSMASEGEFNTPIF